MALAMVSAVSAQSAEMPDFDPLVPGGETWQYINFAEGVLLGFYGPFTQRARNYDCFSESYNLAFEGIKWHNAIKRNLFVDPFDIATQVVAIAAGGFGVFRWLTLCYDELQYSKANPLVEANQSLYGNVSVITDASKGFDVALDFPVVLAIVNSGI